MKLFAKESAQVKTIFDESHGSMDRYEASSIFNLVSEQLIQLHTQLDAIDGQQDEETLRGAPQAIQATYAGLVNTLAQIEHAFHALGQTLPEKAKRPFAFFCGLQDEIAKLKDIPNKVRNDLDNYIIDRRWETTTMTSTTSNAAEQGAAVINSIPDAFEKIMQQRLILPFQGDTAEKLGQLFAPLYDLMAEVLSEPMKLTLKKSASMQTNIISLLNFLVPIEEQLTQLEEKKAVKLFIEQLIGLNKLIAVEADKELTAGINEFLDPKVDEDGFLHLPTTTTTSEESQAISRVFHRFVEPKSASTEKPVVPAAKKRLNHLSIAEISQYMLFPKHEPKPIQKTQSGFSPDSNPEDQGPHNKPK